MKALKHVEAIVSAKLSEIKTVFTIMRLEATLARLSILPLVVNIGLLFVVLLSCWLFGSLLIGYGIFFLSESALLSVFLVFLLNLSIFLGLLKYLSFNLKNMSFEKTRAYFSNNESRDHELLEKKNKDANRIIK